MTKDSERQSVQPATLQGSGNRELGKTMSFPFLYHSGSIKPECRTDKKHQRSLYAWQGGKHFKDTTDSGGHGEIALSKVFWAINAQENANLKEYDFDFS